MRAVARQVASIASVGVVIVLAVGNLLGPSNSQVATTTTVASSEVAVISVTSNVDCTYTWYMTNLSPTYRAYILTSNDGRTTVLSAGPGEDTWPWTSGPEVTDLSGATYTYSTYTGLVAWYDAAGNFVSQQNVSMDAVVLETCGGVIATTTTTVSPTTTSSTLGGGTVPPTTTLADTTTTTVAPVTELPFTGPNEGAGILAAIALVLGGTLLYAGDKAHRRYRRSVRVWRR